MVQRCILFLSQLKDIRKNKACQLDKSQMFFLHFCRPHFSNDFYAPMCAVQKTEHESSCA